MFREEVYSSSLLHSHFLGRGYSSASPRARPTPERVDKVICGGLPELGGVCPRRGVGVCVGLSGQSDIPGSRLPYLDETVAGSFESQLQAVTGPSVFAGSCNAGGTGVSITLGMSRPAHAGSSSAGTSALRHGGDGRLPVRMGRPLRGRVRLRQVASSGATVSHLCAGIQGDTPLPPAVSAPSPVRCGSYRVRHRDCCCLYKQGGPHSRSLNSQALDFWMWCLQ